MARVVSLQLHVGHGQPMRTVTEATARVGGGLEGDSHAARAKRALTIVDRSTHDAVGVKPGDLREQITVEGLPDLGSITEGAQLRIGAITVRVNGPQEFRARLEGRRGLVCNVVAAVGPVKLGDAVSVLETAKAV